MPNKGKNNPAITVAKQVLNQFKSFKSVTILKNEIGKRAEVCGTLLQKDSEAAIAYLDETAVPSLAKCAEEVKKEFVELHKLLNQELTAWASVKKALLRRYEAILAEKTHEQMDQEITDSLRLLSAILKSELQFLPKATDAVSLTTFFNLLPQMKADKILREMLKKLA